MILCNRKEFELTEILKTSRTISDLISDTGNNIITLPDEYFDVLYNQNLINLQNKISKSVRKS